MKAKSEADATWYLTVRTASNDYRFCCMSKEKAMATLVEEVSRLDEEVVEAELRHPSGKVERLPMT